MRKQNARKLLVNRRRTHLNRVQALQFPVLQLVVVVILHVVVLVMVQ